MVLQPTWLKNPEVFSGAWCFRLRGLRGPAGRDGHGGHGDAPAGGGWQKSHGDFGIFQGNSLGFWSGMYMLHTYLILLVIFWDFSVALMEVKLLRWCVVGMGGSMRFFKIRISCDIKPVTLVKSIQLYSKVWRNIMKEDIGKPSK